MAHLSTPPESSGASSNKSGSSKRNIFSKILRKKESGSSKSGQAPSRQNSISSKGLKGNHSSSSLSLTQRGGEKSNEHYIDDDVSAYNYEESNRDEDGEYESDVSSSFSDVSGNAPGSTLFLGEDDKANNEKDSTLKYLRSVGISYESLVPPKPIKTSRRNKQSPKTFKNLFLAQELNSANIDDANNDDTSISNESIRTNSSYNSNGESTQGVSISNEAGNRKKIRSDKFNDGENYILQFSRDGKYLAAAGSDACIKIWKVISSPLGRLDESNRDSRNEHGKNFSERTNDYSSAAVFHQKPVRIFRGHTDSIISLDWSKNNFIISGSMDKMVKLWHVDRQECLETFQNEDFVTAVAFHPTDDRFFLSGTLDNKVRIWSILEKNVPFFRELDENVLITAAAMTPDGQYSIIGGFNGVIYIFETKGLHVFNRFEVKETALVNPFHEKSGCRITGFIVFENTSKSTSIDNPFDKWNVLMTTNDSKIRLVNSKMKLVTRFRGLSNTGSTIQASMSEDHRFILSGSEDHWCYIWENNNSIINNKLKLTLKDLVLEGKSHMNDLRHKNKLYAKLIHKNKLSKKMNLEKFLDEDKSYEFISNENSSYVYFHAHHSKVNAAVFAPESTKMLLRYSGDVIYQLQKNGAKFLQDCQEKPDNVTSADSDVVDHIIVTTDQNGLIKVFRQDVARDTRKKVVNYTKNKKNICPKSRDRPDSRQAFESHVSTLSHNKNGSKPQKSASKRISFHRHSSSDVPKTRALRSRSRSKNSDPQLSRENSASTSVLNAPPELPRISSSRSLPGRKHKEPFTFDLGNNTIDVDLDSDDSFHNDLKEAEDGAERIRIGGNDERNYFSDNDNYSSSNGERLMYSNNLNTKRLSKSSQIPLIVNTNFSDDHKSSSVVDFQTPSSHRPKSKLHEDL
ncbi:Piso0_001942 [Millerozyma farinosa CBS 7064]|uniref:Piso0_001942 protein n=1 Tax=Pichia sorbitophila (strain ATCC MYA-4447 / BCRC 22081 / CBS 7064 / NBRC 10061 / NRRL Y-12695) TaxID=559304 RepID=G8YM41_PICSO|nr:Piso0_001942 [Millerozyma farinosa CBS 7064]